MQGTGQACRFTAEDQEQYDCLEYLCAKDPYRRVRKNRVSTGSISERHNGQALLRLLRGKDSDVVIRARERFLKKKMERQLGAKAAPGDYGASTDFSENDASYSTLVTMSETLLTTSESDSTLLTMSESESEAATF
jgi:hypothetical protein